MPPPKVLILLVIAHIAMAAVPEDDPAPKSVSPEAKGQQAPSLGQGASTIFELEISIFFAPDADPLPAKEYPITVGSSLTNFSMDPVIFPVDTTLKNFLIRISPVRPFVENTDAVVSLIKPNGAIHTFKNTLRSDTDAYLVVQGPQLGFWQVHVSENVKYEIDILGASSWDAIISVMVPMADNKLRPLKKNERLESGANLMAYVMTPSEKAKVLTLQLRKQCGCIIEEVPLTMRPIAQGGFTRHVFNFVVPDSEFLLFVRGVDSEGNDVIRASDTVYRTSGEYGLNIFNSLFRDTDSATLDPASTTEAPEIFTPTASVNNADGDAENQKQDQGKLGNLAVEESVNVETTVINLSDDKVASATGIPRGFEKDADARGPKTTAVNVKPVSIDQLVDDDDNGFFSVDCVFRIVAMTALGLLFLMSTILAGLAIKRAYQKRFGGKKDDEKLLGSI